MLPKALRMLLAKRHQGNALETKPGTVIPDLVTPGAKSEAERRLLIRSLLMALPPTTFLHVVMNDADLWLPRDTLLTMEHCIHARPDNTLAVYVETAHLRWMMSTLEQGGTLLDVGAATGAVTLPFARLMGDRISIVAYEPAEAARSLLVRTLERNGIDYVRLRPVAVSDHLGEAEFWEYLPDESGEVPYLPEASSLVAAEMTSRDHHVIRVPVVTLDSETQAESIVFPVCIKIDVEGFELHVLRGAENLLRSGQVFLSIDIHRDPLGDSNSTTEPGARNFLSSFGYTFERMGHVLLCTPPSA